MAQTVKFNVKDILGQIRKDNDSIQKNVHTLCAAGKGKDDQYRADCCSALYKIFTLTEDKSDEFTATIWDQVHDYLYESYHTIQSSFAFLHILNTLVEFYGYSKKRNVASIARIGDLYVNLSRSLRCVVSSHKLNNTSEEEIEQLMCSTSKTNSSLLELFGTEAFNEFSKMKPTLDMLLLRRRSTIEIKLGLKMYSDFIKKTSYDKRNPAKCYSYNYRHKIIPAIEKFLKDERFEVVDAACRLILTVVNHGGPIFHREMESVLPMLLNLMRKYNDCNFCEELYSVNKCSVTKLEWPKATRSLAKLIAETANRIIMYFEVKIEPIQGMDFLIYSIILCDVEKDWDKVYSASQGIFRSFEITSKTKFSVLWNTICRFLTKCTEGKDCFVEMLLVAAHILKKAVSVYCLTEEKLKDEHDIAMVTYEKIDNLLKKYKECATIHSSEVKQKEGKYSLLLMNLYLAHETIYISPKRYLAQPYFEELLPACDWMFSITRYSHEHLFMMLLHGDTLNPVSGNMQLISQYKEKLIPIALRYLTQDGISLNSAALRIFGKVSMYGEKSYEEDCKSALPLIANLLKRTKVCDINLKLRLVSAKFRESASSTMAKIMTVYNYKGMEERVILYQWLQSLPVVMNKKDAEISYKLLLKLIKENNKTVLGPHNRNMINIFNILCYALRYNAFERNSPVIPEIQKLMRDVIVNSSSKEFNNLVYNLSTDNRALVGRSIKNAPKSFNI